MAVLKDQFQRAECCADRQEVQDHRFERNQDRSEPDEQRQHGPAHDERDDVPEATGHGVLIVGIECRQPADRERSAPDPKPPRTHGA